MWYTKQNPKILTVQMPVLFPCDTFSSSPFIKAVRGLKIQKSAFKPKNTSRFLSQTYLKGHESPSSEIATYLICLSVYFFEELRTWFSGMK